MKYRVITILLVMMSSLAEADQTFEYKKDGITLAMLFNNSGSMLVVVNDSNGDISIPPESVKITAANSAPKVCTFHDIEFGGMGAVLIGVTVRAQGRRAFMLSKCASPPLMAEPLVIHGKISNIQIGKYQIYPRN